MRRCALNAVDLLTLSPFSTGYTTFEEAEEGWCEWGMDVTIVREDGPSGPSLIIRAKIFNGEPRMVLYTYRPKE